MTDVLQVGSGNAATSAPRGPARPVALSAVLTAGAVAGGGLVVMVAIAMSGWLASGTGSAERALRVGALGWLVAHGSSIRVGGTTVTAAPLGVTLLIVVALHLVARRTSAHSRLVRRSELVLFGAVSGGSYAGVLVVAGLASSTPTASADLVRAAVAGLVLATLASGAGAAVESGLASQEWANARPDVRSVLRGSLWGAGSMLACCVAITVAMLGADLGTFGRLWTALDPGTVGGIGLALLCLVVLPNLVLWTASVLLGPGFALGTGTSVTLGAVAVDKVPGLPVLAALPAPGPLPGWAILLAAVPVLSGAVGGYVATVGRLESPWWRRAALGGLAGASAGLLVGVLVWLADGSIGPGRMAEAGPRTLLCVLSAVVVMAAGGAVGAVLGHYRGARADDAATVPGASG